MPAGLSPQTTDEVNVNVGTVCRQFVSTRDATHSQQEWLVATDLTKPPYSMAPEDEILIKSAISTLDSALQGVDTTFISRLVGLPTS